MHSSPAHPPGTHPVCNGTGGERAARAPRWRGSLRQRGSGLFCRWRAARAPQDTLKGWCLALPTHWPCMMGGGAGTERVGDVAAGVVPRRLWGMTRGAPRRNAAVWAALALRSVDGLPVAHRGGGGGARDGGWNGGGRGEYTTNPSCMQPPPRQLSWWAGTQGTAGRLRAVGAAGRGGGPNGPRRSTRRAVRAATGSAARPMGAARANGGCGPSFFSFARRVGPGGHVTPGAGGVQEHKTRRHRSLKAGVDRSCPIASGSRAKGPLGPPGGCGGHACAPVLRADDLVRSDSGEERGGLCCPPPQSSTFGGLSSLG